jgi:hypothetical protein
LTGPPPPPPESPLTPQHLETVAAATRRARSLRAAGRLAMFNAICFGTFSAAGLLWFLGAMAFGELDWIAGVMGVGLGAIAWNELRGRRLLLAFDTRAPRVLGWNQLALLALIVAYAVTMMCLHLAGPNPYEEAVQREPRLARVLGDVGRMYRLLNVAVYGALIVATLIFQGLNALYYFTRARVLRNYLQQTPTWALQLQRCIAAAR